jgi:carboxymethylenebutenolidase
METQDVELGYLARPDDTPGPAPGVVMVPDVWGLYDHYKDLARRLAGEGFAVLALDLYRRIGGKPPISSPEEAMAWIDGLDDREVLGDVQAGVDFLAAGPAASRRVGVTGFCMGGQYALLAACGCTGLSACAPFYGMVRYAEGLDAERKPRAPLEALRDLTCPVKGFYGADDHLIPQADVEALRAGLTASAPGGEVIVYPGAGHAFMNDSRPPLYREEAARDAWPRLVGFLRERLAGQSG